MYSILTIANWFLDKESMTPKKLQKLCYYAQAWNLALYKEKMVKENFEAWVHGPVCPILYHTYKSYGWNRIPQTKVETDEKLNEQQIDLLERVWETYGECDGQQLEALTHTELPWQNARHGLGTWDSSNNIISDEDMKKYYFNLYNGD